MLYGIWAMLTFVSRSLRHIAFIPEFPGEPLPARRHCVPRTKDRSFCALSGHSPTGLGLKNGNNFDKRFLLHWLNIHKYFDANLP
jgi:hypothetical protein